MEDEIKNKWDDSWKTLNRELPTPTHLYHILDSIPRKPWFHNFKGPREMVTLINRLRLGHSRDPAHLARINVIPNALCTCGGGEASPQHIFFECPFVGQERRGLLNSLREENILGPYNLTALLALNNLKIYASLHRFVRMGGTNL